MSRPVDLVRAFRGLRVLVIGDAMLDSYLEGSATRLCTEGPVPVVRRTAEEHAPGGAANTAANVRALGADVMFLGVVGHDTSGALLRTALGDRDVDDRWLVEDASAETLHKLRILADDQYVVRYDAGETRFLSTQAREQLLARLDEALPRCDVAVVSDYRYGVLSDEVIARLRLQCGHSSCPLVVDSKDLNRFSQAGATVITPNHLEACLAVEPAANVDGAVRMEEIERIGRRLLDRVDARYAAVTLAGDGVLLLERDGEAVHLPAYRVAQANDVGAGDSFTSALALALGAGAAPIEAARIGIAAGSIAVTRRRTAMVHHQELLQRVSLESQTAPPRAEALAVQLEEDRRRSRTIVFTNGVFDILHAGHVHFLRQAKALGDVLVVGVNSDRSAQQLKGKNRPINSERDRLALVSALDSVDHALLFDEETPSAVIRTLRPHIHVKGGDYADQELPEAEAVREVGGRVEIVPLVGSLSTTSVIERILALAVEDTVGAAS